MDIGEIRSFCREQKIRWKAHALEEEVSSMRCMDCGGKMVESTTVFTVQFGNSVIVIKNVPCFECEICGYTEFSDEVSEKLEKMVNIIKKSSQEVAVLDYNKAA